jgi:K(+)-stimulated pyrophosphate-energized sodium pump
MVLGNMLSKIWEVRIDDDFGGIGPFYYQWHGFWNPFSIIGTLLVKITDDNAKEHKFKSVKYWKLGFYWMLVACYF